MPVRWRVIIRPRAEEDVREAQLWYESQRSELGSEFLNQIRATIKLLEEQPDRRPIYYREFRRVIVRRFPYKIFYRLEPDRVVVFRILHAKRDHHRQL
jgi:toxin ParE1/3/4